MNHNNQQPGSAEVVEFKRAFHQATHAGANYDEAVAVGLAASARAPSPQIAEQLPPLPEPYAGMLTNSNRIADVFTVDQMQEYARAAVVAALAQAAPQAAQQDDELPISRSTYGSLEECEKEHARRAAATSARPAYHWPHGPTEIACTDCGLTMGESRLLGDIQKGDMRVVSASLPDVAMPEQFYELLQDLLEAYTTITDSAYCQVDGDESLVARAKSVLAAQSAEGSGCRMTGGICACRSGGSFGGCAKERADCCTNEHAQPAEGSAQVAKACQYPNCGCTSRATCNLNYDATPAAVVRAPAERIGNLTRYEPAHDDNMEPKMFANERGDWIKRADALAILAAEGATPAVLGAEQVLEILSDGLASKSILEYLREGYAVEFDLLDLTKLAIMARTGAKSDQEGWLYDPKTDQPIPRIDGATQGAQGDGE